jgi:hypothetical protein
VQVTGRQRKLRDCLGAEARISKENRMMKGKAAEARSVQEGGGAVATSTQCCTGLAWE